MKPSEVKPGMVFTTATIVGPVVDGFVEVECWPCKGKREVNVHNLLAGHSRLCKSCAQSKRHGIVGKGQANA